MDLFPKLVSRWLRDLDHFQTQQNGSSKLCFKMDSLRDVSPSLPAVNVSATRCLRG